MVTWTTPDLHEVTPAEIDEMRDWASDCTWADVTAEEIAAIPAVKVAQSVSRHYFGGVSAFVGAC